MFNFFEKNDSEIQQDVINEVKWDPSVASTQLTISTKDGIVTMRGSVPHYYEKSRAEAAAQRVGGVRAVVDEIEVDLDKSYQKSDETLAKAAANALEWDYSVPETGIKVSVENGWVTLKGETEWIYEREAAKKAIDHLVGVRGVINNIIVKTRVSPSDIKEKIHAAFKRSAEIEGREIDVTVRGSIVTLTGKVHSLHEQAEAGLSAWNAPGVSMVENKIQISH